MNHYFVSYGFSGIGGHGQGCTILSCEGDFMPGWATETIQASQDASATVVILFWRKVSEAQLADWRRAKMAEPK